VAKKDRLAKGYAVTVVLDLGNGNIAHSLQVIPGGDEEAAKNRLAGYAARKHPGGKMASVLASPIFAEADNGS
jgi:hypothetical protein